MRGLSWRSTQPGRCKSRPPPLLSDTCDTDRCWRLPVLSLFHTLAYIRWNRAVTPYSAPATKATIVLREKIGRSQIRTRLANVPRSVSRPAWRHTDVRHEPNSELRHRRVRSRDCARSRRGLRSTKRSYLDEIPQSGARQIECLRKGPNNVLRKSYKAASALRMCDANPWWLLL
jgi:hypothetical protein